MKHANGGSQKQTSAGTVVMARSVARSMLLKVRGFGKNKNGDVKKADITADGKEEK